MKEKHKKIKVCLVSTFAYPLFNPKSPLTFGGAEVQMFLLAKKLARSFEVHFVVGQPKRKPMEKHHEVSVWTGLALTKTLLNYLKGPFTLYHTLMKINPDVVIQRTSTYETAICAIFCRINRKKFVYSVSHDLEVTGPLTSQGLRSRFFGLHRADVIVAQTKDQVFLAKKSGSFQGQKMVIIESGYSIVENKEKKQNFILWVARAVSWKQPEIFLDLVRQNPQEKFVMIMPKGGDKNYWEHVAAAAKGLSNLQFIEKVPFTEIQTFFDLASVFVNTSKCEGFPNTFIQACLGKTPILSLNVNPSCLLTNHACGLYCKGKVLDLTKNLRRLQSNSSMYKTCQKNMMEYVKANHDIHDKVTLWSELIMKLLGKA